MSELEVEARETKNDAVVLSLRGVLDVASADLLARELAGIEELEPGTLYLDLGGLDFIDSSGLRVIIAADTGARQRGRRLVLVEGPPQIQRVFEVTRLDGRLDFVSEAPQ